MVTFPNSKINLGLNIISKRDDGFHNIETCFYPLSLTDVLEILPSDKLEFIQTGLPILANTGENICLKAYHLLSADYQLPKVKIHLHKCCPIGAGLGGGSADAAYTLSTIDKMLNLNIPREKLNEYALTLGSDCSFFLQNQPMIGSGRGDRLKPIDLSLKGFQILIIKPQITISTAVAYQWISPQPADSIDQILSKPITSWKEKLKNNFENPVFEHYPILKHLKESLYDAGALYASMSGSGSALFGIFEANIKTDNLFSDVWFWYGNLD